MGEEIAAVNRQFEDAIACRDVERLALLYTVDAVAMPPDGPFVAGRDNIRALWQSVSQQMGLKSVKLETLDLEIDGGSAYEMGQAALTFESSSSAVKYVVVWKLVEGRWRLHRDIWNGKAR
jgi:uncharacterized protein (TIGR02246 family)